MPRKTTKIIAFILCFLLIFEQSGFAQIAGQLDIALHLSAFSKSLVQDKFRPLHLRYLAYDSLKNNFKLLLDKGDLKHPQAEELEESAQQLLNYFFVGVSLPNESFWVNLRPDSPANIIDPELAKTEIGKIFLQADLELKKDTASYTNPQTLEGKQYWTKLYKKAEEIFGYENITIPTLTRPWIVPGEIIIRETSDNAYIYKATLKVMLEQDYLKDSATYNFSDARFKALNEYSSQLIRELIIPKLTKEINNAKKYAPLRQVYYSLILAQWFKQKYYGKGGFYSWLIDKKNLNGLTAKTPYSQDTYFKAYQESFNKGEYNLKESQYTPYGQTMRSYLSGGIAVQNLLASATEIVPGTRVAASRDALGLPKDFLKEQRIPALLENGGPGNPLGDVSVDATAIASAAPEEPAVVTPTVTTAPAEKKGRILSRLDLDKQAKKYSQAGFIDFGGVVEWATGLFKKMTAAVQGLVSRGQAGFVKFGAIADGLKVKITGWFTKNSSAPSNKLSTDKFLGANATSIITQLTNFYLTDREQGEIKLGSGRHRVNLLHRGGEFYSYTIEGYDSLVFKVAHSPLNGTSEIRKQQFNYYRTKTERIFAPFYSVSTAKIVNGLELVKIPGFAACRFLQGANGQGIFIQELAEMAAVDADLIQMHSFLSQRGLVFNDSRLINIGFVVNNDGARELVVIDIGAVSIAGQERDVAIPPLQLVDSQHGISLSLRTNDDFDSLDTLHFNIDAGATRLGEVFVRQERGMYIVSGLFILAEQQGKGYEEYVLQLLLNRAKSEGKELRISHITDLEFWRIIEKALAGNVIEASTGADIWYAAGTDEFIKLIGEVHAIDGKEKFIRPFSIRVNSNSQKTQQLGSVKSPAVKSNTTVTPIDSASIANRAIFVSRMKTFFLGTIAFLLTALGWNAFQAHSGASGEAQFQQSLPALLMAVGTGVIALHIWMLKIISSSDKKQVLSSASSVSPRISQFSLARLLGIISILAILVVSPFINAAENVKGPQAATASQFNRGPPATPENIRNLALTIYAEMGVYSQGSDYLLKMTASSALNGLFVNRPKEFGSDLAGAIKRFNAVTKSNALYAQASQGIFPTASHRHLFERSLKLSEGLLNGSIQPIKYVQFYFTQAEIEKLKKNGFDFNKAQSVGTVGRYTMFIYKSDMRKLDEYYAQRYPNNGKKAPPTVAPLTVHSTIHGLFVSRGQGAQKQIFVNRNNIAEHLEHFKVLLHEGVTVEQAIAFIEGHEALHAIINNLRDQGKDASVEEEKLADTFGRAFALGIGKCDPKLLDEIDRIDTLIGFQSHFGISLKEVLRNQAGKLHDMLNTLSISVDIQSATPTEMAELKTQLEKKPGAEVHPMLGVNPATSVAQNVDRLLRDLLGISVQADFNQAFEAQAGRDLTDLGNAAAEFDMAINDISKKAPGLGNVLSARKTPFLERFFAGQAIPDAFADDILRAARLRLLDLVREHVAKVDAAAQNQQPEEKTKVDLFTSAGETPLTEQEEMEFDRYTQDGIVKARESMSGTQFDVHSNWTPNYPVWVAKIWMVYGTKAEALARARKIVADTKLRGAYAGVSVEDWDKGVRPPKYTSTSATAGACSEIGMLWPTLLSRKVFQTWENLMANLRLKKGLTHAEGVRMSELSQEFIQRFNLALGRQEEVAIESPAGFRVGDRIVNLDEQNGVTIRIITGKSILTGNLDMVALRGDKKLKPVSLSAVELLQEIRKGQTTVFRCNEQSRELLQHNAAALTSPEVKQAMGRKVPEHNQIYITGVMDLDGMIVSLEGINFGGIDDIEEQLRQGELFPFLIAVQLSDGNIASYRFVNISRPNFEIVELPSSLAIQTLTTSAAMASQAIHEYSTVSDVDTLRSLVTQAGLESWAAVASFLLARLPATDDYTALRSLLAQISTNSLSFQFVRRSEAEVSSFIAKQNLPVDQAKILGLAMGVNWSQGGGESKQQPASPAAALAALDKSIESSQTKETQYATELIAHLMQHKDMLMRMMPAEVSHFAILNPDGTRQNILHIQTDVDKEPALNLPSFLVFYEGRIGDPGSFKITKIYCAQGYNLVHLRLDNKRDLPNGNELMDILTARINDWAASQIAQMPFAAEQKNLGLSVAGTEEARSELRSLATNNSLMQHLCLLPEMQRCNLGVDAILLYTGQDIGRAETYSGLPYSAFATPFMAQQYHENGVLKERTAGLPSAYLTIHEIVHALFGVIKDKDLARFQAIVDFLKKHAPGYRNLPGPNSEEELLAYTFQGIAEGRFIIAYIGVPITREMVQGLVNFGMVPASALDVFKQVQKEIPADQVEGIVTHNQGMLTSGQFTVVLSRVYAETYAGLDWADVPAVVDTNGRIVAFGYPQDLSEDIRQGLKRKELLLVDIRVKVKGYDATQQPGSQSKAVVSVLESAKFLDGHLVADAVQRILAQSIQRVSQSAPAPAAAPVSHKEALTNLGLLDNLGNPIQQKLPLTGPYGPNYFIVGLDPLTLSSGGALQCNFICIYDRETRIGTIAHVDFEQLRNTGLRDDDIARPVSADMEHIIELLEKAGASRSRLQVAIINRQRGIDIFDEASQRNNKVLIDVFTRLNFQAVKVVTETDNIEFNLSNGTVIDGNGEQLLSFGTKNDDNNGPPAAGLSPSAPETQATALQGTASAGNPATTSAPPIISDLRAELTQVLDKRGDGICDVTDVLNALPAVDRDRAKWTIAQRMAALYHDAHFGRVPTAEELRIYTEIYYNYLVEFQTQIAVRSKNIVGFVVFYFVKSRGQWKVEDLIVGTFWQGEKIGAALLDTAIENVMLQHVINGNIVPLFYLDPTEDSYSWYQGRVDQQSGQRSEGYFSKREVNGSERRPGWWLEAKEGENRLIHAQIHLDNSRKTSEPDLSAGNPASSSAGGSVSNTNTGVETTTTPLATGVDNAGGINFTALPILTQTTSLPRAVSNPQIGGQSGLKLPAGELDEEWHGIEQALNGGIIPSNERLKEYMLEICVNGDCTQEFDKVLSCIADILRLEEESCYPTTPALREMLMLLESDKSAQEMQLALTTVNVEEKAPEVVTE